MRKILLVAAFLAVGCTDSEHKMANYGPPASIKCYSGGKLIYEGRSIGNVKSRNGYLFKDAADNIVKEISGDCIIAHN